MGCVMDETYKDARLKVKRAKKHIADFTAAVIALENTCTATVEYHAQGGQSLKHEIPNADSALDDLSLIAGDAIHNLRTALDFAWYDTISRCLPDKLSDKTKFPVMKTRQDLEGTLHGIEIDTRCPRLFECMMTQIQPYKGGESSLIWTLHDLDISDKHLLLLSLGTYSSAEGINVRDADGKLHHGATMGTRGSQFFVDFYPGFQIEDKGKLSIAITFQEAGIFDSIPAEGLLSNLSNFVFYSVQLLENI
jgi:hypothetical protein